VPLTDAQRAALLQRPQPLVDAAAGLAVLFSAKAGCTLAVKWFFQQAGLLDEALAYSSWVHDYRIDVFYRSERYRPEALLEPRTRIVKFVRNPYERAVSSYLHALRTGYDDAKIEAFLGRQLNDGQRFSFREFIAFLEADSLSAQRCDPHHKLQVHPLERLGLARPDTVVRVEEARRALPRLERRLGLGTTHYDELRHSHHHTLRSPRASPCADRRRWPSATKGDRLPFPNTHFFYDRSLLLRVRGLYRADFEAYGYDPQQPPSAGGPWARLRGRGERLVARWRTIARRMGPTRGRRRGA